MKWILVLALALPALSFDKWEPNWKFDEKETIQRSFPSTQKILVDNISGAIHVTGVSGSEARVTVQKRMRAESSEALAEAKRDVKLDISPQGSYVRLYVDGPFRERDGGMNYRGDRYYGYKVDFDYELQVPHGTELILKTVNNGDISVKETTGDYEIHNVNGAIELEKIGGSGYVRTINGKVTISFTRNPVKASEFHTLNGQMDVWFQPGISADMKFKTFNGHVYTDFDVTALPIQLNAPESKNGKFLYRGNRMTSGRAGKGGPELIFDTFNGSIRLHTKAE